MESGPAAVEAFLAALDHPMKAEVVALRATVLGADARIGEGLKWNAPSFTAPCAAGGVEDFATMNLRAPDRTVLVLHRGAKRRADAGARLSVADPAGLLMWKDGDRAVLEFRAGEAEARAVAVAEIVRAWMGFL